VSNEANLIKYSLKMITVIIYHNLKLNIRIRNNALFQLTTFNMCLCLT